MAGQVIHTYMPLKPSSIILYSPAFAFSAIEHWKVIADLAESNGNNGSII